MYKNQNSFNSHNIVYHNKRGKKSYPCSSCKKRFFTQEDLLKHTKVKCTFPSFKCTVCERSYFSQRSLTIQTRLEHNTLNKSPFQCFKCNKTFTYCGGLREHKYYFHNKASKSKMYSCAKCDKSYRRRGRGSV